MKTKITILKGGCSFARTLIAEAVATIPEQWQAAIPDEVHFQIVPPGKLPTKTQMLFGIGALADRDWAIRVKRATPFQGCLISVCLLEPCGGETDNEFKRDVIAVLIEYALTQKHIREMFRSIARACGILRQYNTLSCVAREIAELFMRRSNSGYVMPPKLENIFFNLDEMMIGLTTT